MNKYIIYIFATLLLMLAGCRSARQVVTPTPAPTDATTQKDSTTTAGNMQTLEALQVNYNTTVDNISVGGQIRMLTDSVIWISCTKFIELARVRLTPDSVQLHIKPYNQYLSMPWQDFRQQYGIDINFDDVQRILIGGSVKSQVVQALGSDFVHYDNISIPQRISLRLTHPRLHRNLTLHYDALQVNPTALSLPFAIPRGAKPLSF